MSKKDLIFYKNKQKETYFLYEKSKETYSIRELSSLLFVNEGTIKRWEALKSVPREYYLDLLKINNEEINLNDFSYRDKDQFFTSKENVRFCYESLCSFLQENHIDIKKYSFLEPSAGDGSFLEILPQEKTIAMDIEPRNERIIKQDFLNYTPMKNFYITIGNPPFGLRGNKALQFLEHAGKFSDFVAFILPQIFNSDGKGSAKKRVSKLNLVFSTELKEQQFYYPDKKDVKIKTIFQIWSSVIKSDKLTVPTCKTYIEIFSLSDGGTPGSTRNKKKIGICDFYLPSTCFGSKNMKVYKSFEELPNKRGYGVICKKNKEEIINLFKNIKWENYFFESTNSAINLRSSLINQVLIDNGFQDNTV